jgi:hypothetical protein
MTMGVMEILMKALAAFLTLFVFTCPSLTAQDRPPRFQVFAGYSFVHKVSTGPAFNGWDINASWNLKRYSGAAGNFVRYFSLTADLSGVYGQYAVAGAAISPSPGSHLATYDLGYYRFLLGQRFTFSEHKFSPFFQSLIGVSDWREPRSRPSLTMGGGGLDIVLSKHFVYRVFQADYTHLAFVPPHSEWLSQIELRTGVVFRFGKSM